MDRVPMDWRATLQAVFPTKRRKGRELVSRKPAPARLGRTFGQRIGQSERTFINLTGPFLFREMNR